MERSVIIGTLRRALVFTTAVALLGLIPAAHSVRLPARVAAASSGWTTYHHDNTRDGYDATAQAFPSGGPPAAQWSSGALDGDLYAEPLAVGDVVYQATENNSIYALNEGTGAVIWRWHGPAAQPDPANAVGCGNIDPVGITSTPVIDPIAGLIYAVGLVSAAPAAGTKYQLFAVNLSSGAIASGYPINITPTSAAGALDPVYQIQRAALGLAPNGNTVYVAFGGWSGDCTPYHPWVVGVPVGASLGSPLMVYQPQTSSQNGGGIWEPSGMSIDASGNVYVATGNGFYNTNTPCDNTKWDHGDAVIKLSPTLSQLSFFAPVDWCSLNLADADLGSVGPVLLANNQVFTSGKSGDGWLMDTANLGGFAGQLNASTTMSNCNAVFGGFAYVAPTLYVPCDGAGLLAVNVNSTAHTLSVAWQTGPFSPSAPIVAGGVVWTMSSSALLGFDATTGAQRFTIAIGSHTRFATPTEDNGWFLVPQQNSVAGFSFAWQSIGGTLTSDADIASGAAGRLDVFARGTDNAIWHRTWSGTSWLAWESLGGNLTSGPSAVSSSATRIDMFARGADMALWHRWWDGTTWHAWESLGGTLSSSPDAASCGANNLAMFAVGTDGRDWRRLYNGSWSAWQPVSGAWGSNGPGVVCQPTTTKIDIVERGPDRAIWWLELPN